MEGNQVPQDVGMWYAAYCDEWCGLYLNVERYKPGMFASLERVFRNCFSSSLIMSITIQGSIIVQGSVNSYQTVHLLV